MNEINDIYIVDYIRTPFSRSRPGNPERSAFSNLKGYQLVGLTLKNLLGERLGQNIKPEEFSEFYCGCALPVGSNWPYGARNAWFAGQITPSSVPTVFVDRACGSAMTAMHFGIMSIMTGFNDAVIASGFEHMYAEPLTPDFQKNTQLPGKLVKEEEGNDFYRGDVDLLTGFQMVSTAQKLYEEEIDNFTRKDMDEWSVRSHKLASQALEEGFFKGEILPVEGVGGKIIDHDLAIRAGTTYEKTASLRPVSSPGFRGGYKNRLFSRAEYKEKTGTTKGMITAANASPLNAGAASCVLMSKEKMEKHGLKPLARIVSMGWAGVDPSVMGRGPVPATKVALEKANLKVEDIDYWEINEAFAIVVLNAIKELGIDPDKVNVKGGAIAIGHPLGASGVRLPGTLARILQEKKARYGAATLCCGGGQGVTLILENPNV